MQAVKNKLKSTIKNKKNERLKSIYKDTNSMLSLKQPKNLYRELTSPRFMSNFANIRKPGTYKWSDKFKKCNEKETYIRKTIGDNTKGLKLE